MAGMENFLKIGSFDITPFIAYNGLKWQKEDVDGPDAGRDLSATLHRDRVATKIRLDVTCKPLLTSQLSKILQAIQPETFPVTYFDPIAGKPTTKTMYSNNFPVTFQHNYGDGRWLWSGLTFPLIEV